jgi:hypothetical protein
MSEQSEKDANLAQKLGQLQHFIAVFPHECTGQLDTFWGQLHNFLAQAYIKTCMKFRGYGYTFQVRHFTITNGYWVTIAYHKKGLEKSENC